ncbi:hypothetical protein FRX31_015744 [Thalictrum thalictroides]|uniref:Uncharacterized protein n=1 Tax=Thalictrum thalictroides TaxID=46969 RepID=A0A7J6WBD7_THATH|nr:hypothetical protein FRX31_015744 [Thalictrum thalictroides]
MSFANQGTRADLSKKKNSVEKVNPVSIKMFASLSWEVKRKILPELAKWFQEPKSKKLKEKDCEEVSEGNLAKSMAPPRKETSKKINAAEKVRTGGKYVPKVPGRPDFSEAIGSPSIPLPEKVKRRKEVGIVIRDSSVDGSSKRSENPSILQPRETKRLRVLEKFNIEDGTPDDMFTPVFTHGDSYIRKNDSIQGNHGMAQSPQWRQCKYRKVWVERSRWEERLRKEVAELSWRR